MYARSYFQQMFFATRCRNTRLEQDGKKSRANAEQVNLIKEETSGDETGMKTGPKWKPKQKHMAFVIMGFRKRVSLLHP